MRRSDGFTLIELVIAVSVLGIVLAAVLAVLATATRTEHGSQQRADTMSDLRTSLARVAKDTRQALSVSTASTRDRIEMSTLVNGAPYTVVYSVTGSSLYRSAAPEGQPLGALKELVGRITDPSAFCYDPPNCVLAVPASTHPPIVRITLRARPQGSTVVLTAAGDVELRNTP